MLEVRAPFTSISICFTNSLVVGIAGGAKVIVNGIFFKFALDSVGLYGGHVFAAKAAGCELRGTNCSSLVALIINLNDSSRSECH